MDVTTAHGLVLEVLHQASSQDPSILRPAESKLKEWETEAGFYSILNNIITNHTLDVNVRFMAVLYMKNGIDKYWRKNAPNGITEPEKCSIRQNILLNFNEPVNQIAIQRAVLISKIARIDYPREWPELFPLLLNVVESNDILIQHRALLTLHHVVKTVSSKRLAGDRRLFQELTNQMFPYILNLWNELTTAFIQGVMQNVEERVIETNLEKALLLLRILRKLSVFGFLKPHTNKDCMTFIGMIFEKAKSSLICYKQMKTKGSYMIETCEKFIVHLTKVVISMLDTHPFSFIDFIKPSLELCLYYLFTDDGITFLFERLVIQFFNIIKAILLCAEYRASSKNSMANKDSESYKAYLIKQECFVPEVISDVCKKLIGHYFILTQDELGMWDSDPEAFSNDESGDSWKYSLRPSMDTVFVTIFHEYNEVLTPVLLEMIRSTNIIVPPEDMQQILKKDAIYNAAGLCAFDLYDEVDFDQWFSNTLVQELKIKHNNYRVIRRRVAALIGRWTGIKLSREYRPALYECIVGLLQPDEDIVVRLTAATALRFAVDDFEFNSEQFKHYMFAAFDLLFELLKKASECDTKMQVLNVMAVVLERMGGVLMPHSDALVQYLPHLWNESEGHYMLRGAIVATLVQLVRSMGGVPEELCPFLLPIIQLGTDTSQGAIIYLLEDALDLWTAVLEYSASMTNDLMQLFNNMPILLDYSTEILRTCLYISLAHLLLAPELVMRNQGTQLITTCATLMGDLNNEGIVMLMRLVETFTRTIPQLGSETVMPILPKIFRRIYDKENYPYLMSMFLCVMSRVLLSSHQVFTRAISAVAQELNENDQAVLKQLLDRLLNNMPNVSQLDQRKLLGLALANLLTTQSPTILQRFSDIMSHILEVLNDITKTEEDGSIMDSLILIDGQSPSDFDDDGGYYDTYHDMRKKQLILNDPVHTIVLKDYLQSQVNELRNQIGPQYQQLINTLHADDMSQLQSYITF